MSKSITAQYELIIPVGTSLLTNWMRRVVPEIAVPEEWLAGKPGSEGPSLATCLPRLKARLGDARTSAEIDSTRRWLAQCETRTVTRITLLVSDSESGRWVADALQNLLPYVFVRTVTMRRLEIPRLHATTMREGLVELIRTAARAIKDAHERGMIPIVNATSGFKAESALVTLLGCLLGTEIFYLHEHMQDVAVIPSIPLRWNVEPEFVRVLRRLGEATTRDAVRDSELSRFQNAWGFVERIGAGRDEIWGLSALGQMLIESETGIEDLVLDSRPSPEVAYEFVQREQGHTPKDAENLVREIGRKLPFVVSARLYKFDGANSTGLLAPREDDATKLLVRLRLKPKDADFTLRYLLKTTAKDHAQWMQARHLVGETFGRVSLTDELTEDELTNSQFEPRAELPREITELDLEQTLLRLLSAKEVDLRQLTDQLLGADEKLRAAESTIHQLQVKLGKKRKQLETVRMQITEMEAELLNAREKLAEALILPTTSASAVADPGTGV